MPLGIGIFVFIIDQLVKLFVVSTMHIGQSIPVIDGIFSITYVLNPGAAFGMLEHQRWIFILAAMGVMMIAAVCYRHIQRENMFIRCGSGLLLGGAAGNLADRIQTGLVIDFFDFHIWPVFNLADVAICVGAGILIWDIWQRRNEDEDKDKFYS